MNAKHTWIWVLVAAVLFTLSVFLRHNWRDSDPGPQPVLPWLKAAAVAKIHVYPAGRFGIRAERTNGTWVLTEPIQYPAQAARIENLLRALEHLAPAAPPLTTRQLRQHPKAESEYGLENPQASLVIEQEKYSRQIRLGALTAPGDQVFLRVVGVEDIYVVDAELLKLIPRVTNDWRDTGFVDLPSLAFDHLILSNAANGVIEFQRTLTNLWRMTYPIPRARADNARIAEFLQQLQSLQVVKFDSDAPVVDLESFGLQPAEVVITLARGTNTVARLGFGKTNTTGQIFARRQGVPGVVTVPAAWPTLWRTASFNDFRDRHLVTVPPAPGPIEVKGEDQFTLRPQDQAWGINPQGFPVDAKSADEFLATLANVEVGFFLNAVTDRDLRTNGLVAATREITLKLPAPAGGTNPVLAQLAFGITNDNKVLVARTDEDSIYALPLADFERLPWASWKLRERHLWHFTGEDVARITTRQAGKIREIVRRGTNSWTLATGSQGIINSFALEEVAEQFGELQATLWTERAPKDLNRYGINTNSLALDFELKNGGKFAITFGSLAPSQYPYAVVKLDEENWVFEFPLAFYQYVTTYLTPTSNTP